MIYVSSKQVSFGPISAVLGLVAAVGLFFLALPVVLGATVVLGAFAGYGVWRMRKILRRMERECGPRGDGFSFPQGEVIDVTPEPFGANPGGARRRLPQEPAPSGRDAGGR